MYRDMPATPDSFCSVHSRVMMRRTSFFLEAATTTREPRWAGAATTGARAATGDAIARRAERETVEMVVMADIFSVGERVGAALNSASSGGRALLRDFRIAVLHVDGFNKSYVFNRN
jgi:hypothetical protein